MRDVLCTRELKKKGTASHSESSGVHRTEDFGKFREGATSTRGKGSRVKRTSLFCQTSRKEGTPPAVVDKRTLNFSREGGGSVSKKGRH